MVRQKSSTFRRARPFAPTGKLLMIERNRSLQHPTSNKTTPAYNSFPRALSPVVNTTTPKSQKKKLRSGVKAIREIKKYQGTTSLLIPKASFSKLVREIVQVSFQKPTFRFSTLAMMALQEATEMAIINLLELANLCCLHAKRVTLSPSDIRLTRRAFGVGNPVNN